MKKVIIVSCFFKPNSITRGYQAYKHLSKNFDVKVLYSNFSHKEKDYVIYEGNDFIGIDATSYSKNISLKRVISHISFAKNVNKYIKYENPDIVYIVIPPNIGAYYAIRGIKSKTTKIVIDIIDIWPEALPIPSVIKKIQNLTYGPIWKYFRKYAFEKSDLILSESKFFIDKLNLHPYKNKIKVLHLSKTSELKLYNEDFLREEKDVFTIGYLGAINNIYDFENLINIANKIDKKVKIHIIGEGEKREWLLKRLADNSIEFEFHGKIFDDSQKFNILNNCDFGFNGFKDSTEVALSFKSIDYLSYGIPLINSAKGDTWDLVNELSIGFNYSSNDINTIVKQINRIHNSDIETMKKNSYQTYLKYFEWNVYEKKMDEVIKDLHL